MRAAHSTMSFFDHRCRFFSLDYTAYWLYCIISFTLIHHNQLTLDLRGITAYYPCYWQNGAWGFNDLKYIYLECLKLLGFHHWITLLFLKIIRKKVEGGLIGLKKAAQFQSFEKKSHSFKNKPDFQVSGRLC